MEALKGWAIGACMASLAGTVVHFLSPSGNVQRIFKVVISVFFITVLIYPIGLLGDGISDITEGYTYPEYYADNVEKIGDVLLQQSINQLELVVESVVEELEITDYEISIKTDIDSDDSIVISSIDVTVSESCSERAQELSVRLLEDVDCQVNVYVGGL